MQKVKWERGSHIILGGPIELFPKTIMLFANCGIGYWISIRVTSGTTLLDFENTLLLKHGIISMMPFLLSFPLDFENTLLSKCGISSLMPFLHSFSLDIV
jgi:hypothetical protein